ncbi:MAG: sulfatase-like hydrolase/transferase [Verrucomicrobiota bacterium]
MTFRGRLLFQAGFLGACLNFPGGAFATEKPNLIIFFADDAGYADFGFQGGGIGGDFADLTPNLDALAADGVRFTNGYASAAVCTPSRAGLLTGRYQHRFGVETVYGPLKEAGMPASEVTMADVLRDANYRTWALGKWHLGESLLEHHPNQRGFDEFYGVLAGARTFFPYQGNHPASRLQRNGQSLPEPPDQPYFTDVLAAEAVASIDRHVKEHPKKPFFLYFAFTAVHTPLEADPERLADPRIQDIAPAERKTLAAMTMAMDDAVGSVMKKLKEAGEAENTMVVFLSDNGGPEDNENLRAPNWSDNGVLRGSKSQNFEGGIRVPFLIHWPEGMAASRRGQTVSEVVSALDLLPTFAAAGAAPLPDDREFDGINLLPFLRGEGVGLPDRALFWRQVQQRAVRKGDWKFYQLNDRSTPELYDLAADPGETTNLASDLPEKLAELQAAYMAWDKDMIEPLWTARGMRVSDSSEGADSEATPSRNLEASFHRLDRNRDGKVTRQELPRAEVFDRLDRNGDGMIEAVEIGIRSRRPSPTGDLRGSEAEMEEDSSEVPVINRLTESEAFLDFDFERDWIPGSRDAAGKSMGGTETNYLVVHEGKLFASIGAWNANREAAGFAGAMVLVKEDAESSWQVDFNAGKNSVRIAALSSMEITTDGEGNPLDTPVFLLAGGVSGFEHPGEVTVFTRNDDTESWEKSVVTHREGRRGGEIRHVFDHVDLVTGIHHVFATASGGELYRAAYDPEVSGRLRWEPEPELAGRLARIMSWVVMNNQLYLAVDITPDAPGNGGLFRRVDGPDPKWEWLGEWGSRTSHVGIAWIRGMAAIRGAEGPESRLILASRETDGVIERVDPSGSPPARTVEFDFKRHFKKVLEVSADHQIGSIIAYNEMTPATHPDTGESVRFLTGGARAFLPGSGQRVDAEALILVRHEDGSYATVLVPPVAGEASLRAVRTIVASPFPEESGRVWYLGGFDAAQGPHEDTAWIYRGEVPKP